MPFRDQPVTLEAGSACRVWSWRIFTRAGGLRALSCMLFNCAWVRKCDWCHYQVGSCYLELLSVSGGVTSLPHFCTPHMFPWSPGWASAIGYSVLVLVRAATQEWWTFVCMSNSYTSHICFYSHPCQFLYLLWQAERQSIEARRSCETTGKTRSQSFHSCIPGTYNASQRKPHRYLRQDCPPLRLLEREKENAYSIEPELHNGCIVELIDFSAHGD